VCFILAGLNENDPNRACPALSNITVHVLRHHDLWLVLMENIRQIERENIKGA
jgi:hypothetical protein